MRRGPILARAAGLTLLARDCLLSASIHERGEVGGVQPHEVTEFDVFDLLSPNEATHEVHIHVQVVRRLLDIKESGAVVAATGFMIGSTPMILVQSHSLTTAKFRGLYRPDGIGPAVDHRDPCLAEVIPFALLARKLPDDKRSPTRQNGNESRGSLMKFDYYVREDIGRLFR